MIGTTFALRDAELCHLRSQFFANRVEIFRQAGLLVDERVEGVLAMVRTHTARANTTEGQCFN